MPKLSWNETRDRALKFSRAWSDATHEQRDKQTFWNEFFLCFGLTRKSVAVFEHSVEKARGHYNYLDLFWPGVLLVEHKSAGASLTRAESQAFAYLADLARQGQADQLPRYVVLCDFRRWVLFDLEPTEEDGISNFEDGKPYRTVEFELRDLHRHVREFSFIYGDKPVRLDPEDPANLIATQLLAGLHDALEETGFSGHELERMLVRMLFCLFAEDTGIFEPSSFTELVNGTKVDGSDLGMHLANLFQVLNTPPELRQSSLDEDIASFPYVNGGLFDEHLRIAAFNSAHREALLKCCGFYWARISPAVFGSLFQGVLDDKKRRQLGAHYTSERDIMKLIRSLILDDLNAELDAALKDRSTRNAERLRAFQKRLRSLKFIDPACGCGNFLMLSYRELRRLETKTIMALRNVEGTTQRELDVRHLAQVDVDQFYGIELGEWPLRIAEVGLWLTDHQCNVELAEELGQSFRRLPLRASPTLRVGNALRLDWRELLAPSEDVLVLGNPPFVGKHLMRPEQSGDMDLVWGEIQGAGFLDYVTAWYKKASEYILDTRIRCAFVSTNSISQGEQVGIMWNYLFKQYGVKIHFAHRTFPWESEARGKAHVHVVIIGFGTFDHSPKRIFEYEPDGTLVTSTEVRNISPYLIEGPDIALPIRRVPLCPVPSIVNGNKPSDGGHLIMSPDEKIQFLRENRDIGPYLRPYASADEFINGTIRYVLWLKDAPPEIIRRCPGVVARLEEVRKFRSKSQKIPTQKKAATPGLFDQVRQPAKPYLAIPKTSSERRRYIPMAVVEPKIIASTELQMIEKYTPFHFGVLTSAMHMSWVRVVCGRLKSDYRYSNKLVYNNYPWPPSLSDKHKATVEECALAVLTVRAKFPNSTLADLYDPLTMPAPLAKAHAALDRAVDRCYRPEAFGSDRARVEYLFALYERLSPPTPKKKETSRTVSGCWET